MCVALVSALALAVRGPDVFIGLVAVFSAYFVYTGWGLGAIRQRRLLVADRIALGLLAVAALAMYGFGFVMRRDGEGLFPVPFVFGTFAAVLVAVDWRRRRGWPSGADGVALHLLRMSGASIATVTAVFVVDVRTEPEFVAWLVPSAVLVPTFVVLARRFRGRAHRARTPTPTA